MIPQGLNINIIKKIYKDLSKYTIKTPLIFGWPLINQILDTEVFFKLDNLDKDDLSNFLIFKEALNWKSVLWNILKKNFDTDGIDEFFLYIDNLGENFQIKDFISQRLYSAHLNYYYGVVIEQTLREIKREDFEKEKNILSNKSFDSLDNEIFMDEVDLLEEKKRPAYLIP